MQDLLHIKNRGFEFWNGPIKTFQPALNVFTKPRPEGFTAVILTYDRFDYMIKVIQRLVFKFLEIAVIFFFSVANSPSCQKILIVWQDQNKPRPMIDSLPEVRVPVHVVKTYKNALSNRFIPYPEIEVRT